MLDFQKIHEDYRPKIQRYLTRIVGEYDAEDLTQEVFLKVSKALSTFRGESQVSTWIYRIAANAALDRLRSPATKRFVQSDLSDCCDTEDVGRGVHETDTKDAPDSLEQRVFHKERYECYRDVINNLPPNYRSVVELSELEELAATEIADILGVSVGSVKIRLHRGRERLLKELRNHCKAEDWL